MGEMTQEIIDLRAENKHLQKWIVKKCQENKALKKDYQRTVDKFDKCRGCLARIAEKIGIELSNKAPKGISEWHEHLIHELDKWKP